MGLNKYFGRIVDQNGQAVPSVAVHVYTAGTLTPSTLYDQSDDGLPPITNPVQSLADGSFSFWVINGYIDVEVRKNGVLTKLNDVHICDCFPAFTGTSRVKIRGNVQRRLRTQVVVRVEAPRKRPITYVGLRVNIACRQLTHAETRAVLQGH